MWSDPPWWLQWPFAHPRHTDRYIAFHRQHRARRPELSNPLIAAIAIGRMSAFGPKQTSRSRRRMSAFGGKADIEI